MFAQVELTQVSSGLTAVRALDCSNSTWRVTAPLTPGAWTVRVRADDQNVPLAGMLAGWVRGPDFTVPTMTGNVQVNETPLTVRGTVKVNNDVPKVSGATACPATGPAGVLHYRSSSGSYESAAA